MSDIQILRENPQQRAVLWDYLVSRNGRVEARRDLVDCLLDNSGATYSVLAESSGLSVQQVRARMLEFEQEGVVEVSRELGYSARVSFAEDMDVLARDILSAARSGSR